MAKEILIYSTIYPSSVESFINAVNEIEEGDITIRINSGGGSVFAGWGIIAKLRELKDRKVFGKVDGVAGSMAFDILLFMDNVEALEVSRFLIHRADMFAETDDQKKLLADINKDLRKALESKVDPDLFKTVTNYTIDEVFDPEKRIDVWIDAKQAKKLGVINKIVKMTDKQAVAEAERYFSIAAVDANATPAPTPVPAPTPTKSPSTMTIEKLRAENPDLVKQIENAAVATERDRVGAWMAYADIDPKQVAEGIKKGENISQTAMAELSRKAMSPEFLAKIKADSTEKVDPAKPKGDEGDNKEVVALESKLDVELGLKKLA